MTVSDYHKKHISRSDEETDRRIFVKELELKKILLETGYKPGFDTVRIAVLGCADKRFVKRHKLIFEKVLQKPVELITFDITTQAPIQADGYFSVPIETYKLKLAQENMKFKDLRWDITLDNVPIPIRGLKGGALVLEK